MLLGIVVVENRLAPKVHYSTIIIGSNILLLSRVRKINLVFYQSSVKT